MEYTEYGYGIENKVEQTVLSISDEKMEDAVIDRMLSEGNKIYDNINQLMTHSWGQKVVRFYDPDGNLIEVGTPV